jgi:geranylgeranyl reductase family protein
VDADVIVTGAGPAGAATAAHLARAGVDVLLVDRARFPRDKVCGDFVGPVALAELRTLGVEADRRFANANVVARAGVHLDGRLLIERSFPEADGFAAFGVVMPRLVLDALIVEAATRSGARLLEGCHVTHVERSPGGVVEVVTAERDRPLRARLVVGADGSNSTVARILRGGQAPRADRIIAVRAYYSGVRGPTDRADLYFTGDSFPGYYWLFPTGPDTANVGVGMMLETVPPVREHLRNLLARLIEADPALRERLDGATLDGKIVGWPLATYNPAQPLVGDAVLLVGDAGGLINSLNGEGIQYSLLSARWAAEVALGGLAKGDLSRQALAPYARRIERELGNDLGMSRLVVRVISCRALNPVWLLALRVIASRARVDPAYADTTGGVLAGVVPSHAVLHPRIVVGTIGQAARTACIDPGREVLQRPIVAAEISVELARTTFDLAYDTARDARSVLGWASSSALTAATLAGSLSRSALVRTDR